MSGFGALLRQRVRRDALQLSLWIGGTALLGYVSCVGVDASYGTQQERTSLLALALANPVILLFRGLPSGSDDGAFITFLILPWLCLLAALMSTFLAVRHSRMDEETGRAEVVAATPAGRWTPTVATIVHGLTAGIVLTALTAAAFAATGLSIGGCLVVGASVGATGILFLGVGFVAAQVMRTARGANALSVTVVLVAFVLAGIGNALGTPSDDLTRMESSWVAWLSPFAWAENTRAFADDALWPIALLVCTAVVLLTVAGWLQSLRDLGGGFIAERRGRRDARPWLASPFALVWRLTSGSAAAWAIGGLATGLLSTSLASLIDQVGSENPAVAEILAQISGQGSMAQGLLITFFTMAGILAACAGVQTVIRARQEEAHGTAEPVLALPVGRVRWLAAFLGGALVAVLIVCGATALGAALGVLAGGGDGSLARDALVCAAGQAAAASVLIVLTALVFVLAPRLTIAGGWSLVLLGATLGLFGPLFGLPEWAAHLSPFAVTPVPTPDGVDVRGLWWLGAAILVGGAAVIGLMRRRELASDG